MSPDRCESSVQTDWDWFQCSRKATGVLTGVKLCKQHARMALEGKVIKKLIPRAFPLRNGIDYINVTEEDA